MNIRGAIAFWIAPIAGAITGFSTFFPLGNHWLNCTYEAAIGAAVYSALAACIAIVALLILDRVLRRKSTHKAVSFALIPIISGCAAALTFLPSGEFWMQCHHADLGQGTKPSLKAALFCALRARPRGDPKRFGKCVRPPLRGGLPHHHQRRLRHHRW